MEPIKKLSPEKTLFFLCDIQETWTRVIKNADLMISISNLMIQAAEKFNIQTVITEHYKKGFGATDARIKLSDKCIVFQKTLFSMVTDEVISFLNKSKAVSVVLWGVETHVCVLQTAIDLLNRGMKVYLAADAVFSQRTYDRETALSRLEKMGVVVSTSESVLFELMKDATHPAFKGEGGILNLLKNPRPEMK